MRPAAVAFVVAALLMARAVAATPGAEMHLPVASGPAKQFQPGEGGVPAELTPADPEAGSSGLGTEASPPLPVASTKGKKEPTDVSGGGAPSSAAAALAAMLVVIQVAVL